MTKMSEAQRTAILAAHVRHLRRIGGGMVSARPATIRVLRRNGWINDLDRPTRAGLIAAGVDMDELHAQAQADRAVVCGRNDEAHKYHGYSVSDACEIDMDALHAEALVEDKSVMHHPAFGRAQEIGAAERQRAAAKAGVDNRDEIGAPRTQRFHSLFKTTRSWSAALDILHAEALLAGAEWNDAHSSAYWESATVGIERRPAFKVGA